MFKRLVHALVLVIVLRVWSDWCCQLSDVVIYPYVYTLSFVPKEWIGYTVVGRRLADARTLSIDPIVSRRELH